MISYNLIKYSESEYEFVYKVKKILYKKYIEKYWGVWDETEQRKRFLLSMNRLFNDTYIIMQENHKIGFIQYTRIDSKTISIDNICIIPDFQNKGIGTAILKDILEEYSSNSIKIQYFKDNLVGNLYKRLGFELEGESEFHYQMIKRNGV